MKCKARSLIFLTLYHTKWHPLKRFDRYGGYLQDVLQSKTGSKNFTLHKATEPDFLRDTQPDFFWMTQSERAWLFTRNASWLLTRRGVLFRDSFSHRELTSLPRPSLASIRTSWCTRMAKQSYRAWLCVTSRRAGLVPLSSSSLLGVSTSAPIMRDNSSSKPCSLGVSILTTALADLVLGVSASCLLLLLLHFSPPSFRFVSFTSAEQGFCECWCTYVITHSLWMCDHSGRATDGYWFRKIRMRGLNERITNVENSNVGILNVMNPNRFRYLMNAKEKNAKVMNTNKRNSIRMNQHGSRSVQMSKMRAKWISTAADEYKWTECERDEFPWDECESNELALPQISTNERNASQMNLYRFRSVRMRGMRV